MSSEESVRSPYVFSLGFHQLPRDCLALCIRSPAQSKVCQTLPRGLNTLSVQGTLLQLRLPLRLHLAVGATSSTGAVATMMTIMVMVTGAAIMMTAVAGAAGTAAEVAIMVMMVGQLAQPLLQMLFIECTKHSMKLLLSSCGGLEICTFAAALLRHLNVHWMRLVDVQSCNALQMLEWGIIPC